MATFTVTTNIDELDDLDGAGTRSIANFGGINDISLREAIALANDNPDFDRIEFDADVFSGGPDSRILLTQGELVIDNDIDIDASSAGGVTLDGQSASRVLNFDFQSGLPSFIRNVTITGGRADGDGGGILSRTFLEIQDSALVDNTASESGGGLSGPLTRFQNSLIEGNTSGQSGGGVSARNPDPGGLSY